MWQEIELLFNRALRNSFSKKKLLAVFLTLLACGVLVVLCRILSEGVNAWMGNSLAFLPTFICTGVLMGAGVPLIRAYHDEVKGRPLQYRRLFAHAWKLMVGVFSFTVPLVVAYLVLWVVLGIFFLVKGIPNVGGALGVIFSFGPFLLILGSLVLSAISLLLLFFITPIVALKSVARWDLAEELYARLKADFFSHIVLLGLGLIPLVVTVSFLVLAAALTGMTYFVTERTWAIALQWFFIMIPFAALLSPALLFFFNFSAESFVWMQKRLKQNL